MDETDVTHGGGGDRYLTLRMGVCRVALLMAKWAIGESDDGMRGLRLLRGWLHACGMTGRLITGLAMLGNLTSCTAVLSVVELDLTVV